MARIVEQTILFSVVHRVNMYDTYFSQSLFWMCWGFHDGGYWGLVDGVRSSEQVQCDWVAVLNVVRVIFTVLRREDGAIIGESDGSSSHPRICGTKDGFSVLLSLPRKKFAQFFP